MTGDDELFKRVEDKAREFFHWSGRPTIENVQTWHELYSVINKISIKCNGDRRVVYAKSLKDHDEGQGAAGSSLIVHEFEMLRTLDPHFSGCARLGVVRPIAVFPETKTLVTEEAPGVALQTQMARAAKIYAAPWEKTPILGYCTLAGQWLRKFQKATAKADGDFDIDDLVSYCDERLRDLVARPGSSFSEQVREVIIRNIVDLKSDLGPDSRKISARHNDYSPHNIFVHGEAIRVLDFGFADYGSWAYDVYRFWHVLECLKSSPQFLSSRLAGFQEAFLSAYGGDTDLSAALFRMVGHRYQITKLCAIYEDRSTPGPRGWVARRLYRKGRNWLLSQ